MDQYNQKVAQLEARLQEALAAEDFFERASGKLIVELLSYEITKLTNDITSDKYLKDHVGYVNANTELRVARRLLTRHQALANPKTRDSIAAKLEEHEDGTE